MENELRKTRERCQRDLARDILLEKDMMKRNPGHFFALGTAKFRQWWDDETPLRAICSTFTIITVINSLMMITGFDIPKQGLFAYIHMMSRLMIVSLIIGLMMWKDVWVSIKNTGVRAFFIGLYTKIKNGALPVLFTFLTAVYCLFMIVFASFLRPSGGINFYRSLVILFLCLSVARIAILMSRKILKKSRKNHGNC
jgi:hypothetical protein